MILPPRNLSDQLGVCMPVLREQLNRISGPNPSDGYHPEDEYPAKNAEYEEGNIPLVSPTIQNELIISVRTVKTIGRGEYRTYVVDGYQPFQMQSNMKELMLNVKINSYQLTDEENAWTALNNIKDRIQWRSVLDEFQLVNLGYLRTSDLRNISFNFQGRTYNSMDMDVYFSTSTNDVDWDTGNWIQSVELIPILETDTGEIITDNIVLSTDD